MVILVGRSRGSGSGGMYVVDARTLSLTRSISSIQFDGQIDHNLLYYPPTETMYLFLRRETDAGSVVELTLDREGWSRSTSRFVETHGESAAGGETTGFAYDSRHRLFGGGVRDGRFFTFDPATSTWSNETMRVESDEPSHQHGMALSAGACDPRTDGYERRRPEETLLYRVVHEHWPTFAELAEEQGSLPSFVTREFDEYLRCGILEHGLVHLCCERCGHAMVVAFSCKRRAFCPSCTARRMSDVAAHLVGSTADQLLRHAEAPVLVVPHAGDEEHTGGVTRTPQGGTWVVAFDGTDPAGRALRLPSKWSKTMQSRLALVHASSDRDAEKQMRAFLGELGDPELTKLAGALTVLEETPAEAILAHAAAERASLVVIGSHGRKGLARAFFGSVAASVVRGTNVPVLCVR